MGVVSAALPVLEYRLLSLRRTWRGHIFSSVLLPVLFLAGMGISVGGYVDRGGALGVPYLDYIAPGLLASTAIQIAVTEAMWPVRGAFFWHRQYHAMRSTPLRPADIVAGEFWFLTVRVGLPATSFLTVMAFFGTVHSWWAVAAIPAAMLTGASVTGAIMAYSATVDSDNMFALLFRFVLIPMTLFSGVFFPVSAMPLAARWCAYLSPLWHGVELCRAATLGIPTAWPALAHAAYLGGWVVIGFLLARWRFRVRLSD
ncbi:MAG TPA: ABC transporter permease [Micromonosporaceae bacterium]